MSHTTVVHWVWYSSIVLGLALILLATDNAAAQEVKVLSEPPDLCSSAAADPGPLEADGESLLGRLAHQLPDSQGNELQVWCLVRGEGAGHALRMRTADGDYRWIGRCPFDGGTSMVLMVLNADHRYTNVVWVAADRWSDRGILYSFRLDDRALTVEQSDNGRPSDQMILPDAPRRLLELIAVDRGSATGGGCTLVPGLFPIGPVSESVVDEEVELTWAQPASAPATEVRIQRVDGSDPLAHLMLSGASRVALREVNDGADDNDPQRLTPGVRYVWQVRVAYAADDRGPWSPQWFFTFIDP